MIIGNGDIATALREIDQPDRIFFASGVSNSAETRGSEFLREVRLLRTCFAANPSKRLIYFSSLSVFYADTAYAFHKQSMESLVRMAGRWTIIRLGNIDWGTNPHTLINYLRDRAKKGLPLEIQDVYRYVVDRDEFLHWMNLIPDWNCELNIPGRRMKVAEIVKEYVEQRKRNRLDRSPVSAG